MMDFLNLMRKERKGAVQLRETDKLVGARVGDVVYLHKDLKNHPLLYDAVLNHELRHSSSWSIKDFINDLNFSEGFSLKIRIQYWKFLFKHPKALLFTFSPYVELDGVRTIDLNLIIFYLSLFLVLFFIYLIK